VASKLVVEIAWDIDQKQFKEQVRQMIAMARKGNNVLTLPISSSLESMLLILSQVNCDGCDAICCRVSPPDEMVAMTPSEYKMLRERYGDEGMVSTRLGGAIKMPCRFLKNKHCSIYPERPLSCVVFPIQPGGAYGASFDSQPLEALAVSSYCPEGRRIAKAVYMTMWQIKQKIQVIGFEEASELLSKRN